LRSRRGGFVRRERGRARYEWRSAVGARIRSCASRASVRPLGSEAAYISLSMARSPNAWGMTLVRRRSSPNSCSSRLVVRIACRCASGKRRCVMHASKSSCKHASPSCTSKGNGLHSHPIHKSRLHRSSQPASVSRSIIATGRPALSTRAAQGCGVG
jgi:hypothetical protein